MLNTHELEAKLRQMWFAASNEQIAACEATIKTPFVDELEAAHRRACKKSECLYQAMYILELVNDSETADEVIEKLLRYAGIQTEEHEAKTA